MHENPGSTYQTNNSTQVQFNAGVTISGDIGIDLSAQTSWDTSDQTTLTAPGGGTYSYFRLCGSASTPPNAPQKL